MRTPSNDPRPISHVVGELCIGGDWACAHGDVAALRHVAQCLAAHAHEPIHFELLGLAETCNHDPDRAVALWVQIKDRVLQANAT